MYNCNITVINYADWYYHDPDNPIGPDHDAKARGVVPLYPYFPCPLPVRRLGITCKGMDAGHHYFTNKFENSLHRARGHVVQPST